MQADAPARHRIDIEPEKVEQGLAKLVLVVVELIRQLLEKQALRRIEGGRLVPDQVEKLATTMAKLEQQVRELQEHFGIDDLDLDLGPLGKVFDNHAGAKRTSAPRS
jgi:hypothetical protein